MNIRIKPLSDVPIYKQISNFFKHQILSGELRANEKLPSSRNLGMELKINMLTIQKAYKELREQGLIYNKRGEGAFVCETPEQENQMKSDEVRQNLSKVIHKASLYGLEPENISQIFNQCLQEDES